MNKCWYKIKAESSTVALLTGLWLKRQWHEFYYTTCLSWWSNRRDHWPLARYVKLRVAHAPGMPGTFPPAADFKGNRRLAIPACITANASRTCRDACRDRLPAVAGKTFPAFRAHAHPQFYVSGKRSIDRLLGQAILATLTRSWPRSLYNPWNRVDFPVAGFALKVIR